MTTSLIPGDQGRWKNSWYIVGNKRTHYGLIWTDVAKTLVTRYFSFHWDSMIQDKQQWNSFSLLFSVRLFPLIIFCFLFYVAWQHSSHAWAVITQHYQYSHDYSIWVGNCFTESLHTDRSHKLSCFTFHSANKEHYDTLTVRIHSISTLKQPLNHI